MPSALLRTTPAIACPSVEGSEDFHRLTEHGRRARLMRAVAQAVGFGGGVVLGNHVGHFPAGHVAVRQETQKLLRDLCEVLLDRKSTRLNSSHLGISYAVF